jgi:hypothetical protein
MEYNVHVLLHTLKSLNSAQLYDMLGLPIETFLSRSQPPAYRITRNLVMQFIVPKRIKRGLGLLLTLFLLALMCPGASAKIHNKSGALSIVTQSGKYLELYQNSHALLIGVQDYKTGWRKLPNLKQHIKTVQKALHAQGFNVVTVWNPDSKNLKAAFEDFIERYGYDMESRLLFYFGGHGAMRKDGRTGYLAPSDAPLPKDDPKAFKRKALSISRVLAWCKDLESRHAMFLFDSSLEANLFEIKEHGPSQPISAQTARPVRFIISSGATDQDSLAQSAFAPALAEGLEGKADLNRDGYITGSELGLFVHKRVLYSQTGQTPQYGKLREAKLDEGDFIFKPSGALAAPDSKAAKVARLLKEAKALFTARKFSKPDEVNALDKYHQALSLDPLNLDAQVGLGLIIEEYTLWARNLMKSGELAKAEEILKRAESVREGDTEVIRLWQELSQLKSMQPKAPPGSVAGAEAEPKEPKPKRFVADQPKEPKEARITPKPAKPRIQPELIKIRFAKSNKSKSGVLNLVWANAEGSPSGRYQRIYVWLGKADPKTGVWRYRKQRAPDLEKGRWASRAAPGLESGPGRLLVSGCRVWNGRKNVCSQEETIPVSTTQKRSEKPKDYLSLTSDKLPSKVILDHHYVPPALLKAAAARSSVKLRGKLRVTASLDDGSQPPKNNPIWVYVKVYDRQDRLVRVLRKPVQQDGKAVFDYAKFGKKTDQATVFAFWPGDLGPGESRSGAGLLRKRGYYLPEIRTLGKLDKSSSPPRKLIIRLNPMPSAKQMQALATIENQFIAKLNGNGLHRITEAGSGVLQGQYKVWIPLIDGRGSKADNMMAMLLLFNRAKELKYGHVVYSQTAKDGRSYAVYPAEIFNHDVYLAQLFVCSPENPDRFVPKIENLDTSKPEVYEPGDAGDKGSGGYASFPLVRVDVLNGQSFSGVSSGPAKSKKRTAYRHPRRGVLNALVLDQDAKPLHGVSAMLLSEEGPRVWAQSGESGLISIPLLDQEAMRLELNKDYYEFASGTLSLNPRPRKIHHYRFSRMQNFEKLVKRFFVSLELAGAAALPNLVEKGKSISAFARMDGKPFAKGEYDGNGYINFKELIIPNSYADKTVEFMVYCPGYEPARASFKIAEAKPMVSLKVTLKPGLSKEPLFGSAGGLVSLYEAAFKKRASKTGPKTDLKPAPRPKPKPRVKSQKTAKDSQSNNKKPAKPARLKGKLMVSVSLDNGFRPPVHENIWVYVKSYDRKGNRLAIIGKEVNADGKALFRYSRLGRGASKLEIMAFYPHYIEEAGSGGNGEKGYNTHARSLYFQPCQKVLTSLHKPGKAPKKIDMLLELMPEAVGMDGDPGEGLLRGQYRLWVPVVDDMGHAVEDIFCMLLLFDKRKNLIHGSVVLSRMFNNGMSYAEYHSQIFNRKVASAKLFLCSPWQTASYIPRLEPLNTKDPRKFKIDDGYIMLPAAELPDTKIEMVRGGPDQAMRPLQ